MVQMTFMRSGEIQLYPATSAVYFLLDVGRVVYVGRTSDLRNSFNIARHADKKFQQLRYVEVPLEDLDRCEMACIVFFAPKYNKERHTKKVSAAEAEACVREILSDDDLELLGVERRVPVKYEYDYPKADVTVDCVVFGFDYRDAEDPFKVLLIQRRDEPFQKHWALPGGFVEFGGRVLSSEGESLERAAQRELEEETGLHLNVCGPNDKPENDTSGVPAYLEQLYTFGAPKRDPRGRVISVAYFVLVRTSDYEPKAGSDASQAVWVGVRRALDLKLAFDHREILNMALTRVRNKIRYEPIGFNMLPEEFTLSEIRALYEGITQRELDPSNFRKRVLATNVLVETGGTAQGQGGRPAQLYAFDKQAYDTAVRNGFNFEI
jgi:8-oxo-dGTP diphosphatase